MMFEKSKQIAQMLIDNGHRKTPEIIKLQENKILIRQYILETDIHPFVKGVTFKRVWQNKVRSKIGSTEAFFASLDDLIEMKAAAGRPKDLEDLKVLRKLAKKSI